MKTFCSLTSILLHFAFLNVIDASSALDAVPLLPFFRNLACVGALLYIPLRK